MPQVKKQTFQRFLKFTNAESVHIGQTRKAFGRLYHHLNNGQWRASILIYMRLKTVNLEAENTTPIYYQKATQ